MPWTSPGADLVQLRVLGILNNMAHGEALGNTGGRRTTILEAKINGSYIGKFDNRKSFMSKGEIVTDAANFPVGTCVDHFTLGSAHHSVGNPHAEDFLFAALAVEWAAVGGNWQGTYPRAPGQNFDLLSIKTDKTACPECAQNLLLIIAAYGLKLREKASYLHTGVDGTGATGAGILSAQNVPVRHWSTGKITTYMGNLGKNVGTTGGFVAYTTINNNATNTFPGGGNAEQDWSTWGYGRKINQVNW